MYAGVKTLSIHAHGIDAFIGKDEQRILTELSLTYRLCISHDTKNLTSTHGIVARCLKYKRIVHYGSENLGIKIFWLIEILDKFDYFIFGFVFKLSVTILRRKISERIGTIQHRMHNQWDSQAFSTRIKNDFRSVWVWIINPSTQERFIHRSDIHRPSIRSVRHDMGVHIVIIVASQISSCKIRETTKWIAQQSDSLKSAVIGVQSFCCSLCPSVIIINIQLGLCRKILNNSFPNEHSISVLYSVNRVMPVSIHNLIRCLDRKQFVEL